MTQQPHGTNIDSEFRRHASFVRIVLAINIVGCLIGATSAWYGYASASAWGKLRLFGTMRELRGSDLTSEGKWNDFAHSHGFGSADEMALGLANEFSSRTRNGIIAATSALSVCIAIDIVIMLQYVRKTASGSGADATDLPS